MTGRIFNLSMIILCCTVLCVKAEKVKNSKSPRPQLINIAVGKTITFDVQPNYPDTSDAADSKQLVDGKLASKTPIWYDKKTVGWVGDKRVVFSIDLSTVQAIKGIAVHTGGGKSGVEWPSAILVYTSDDGKNFSMIANLIDKNTIPKSGKYSSKWIINDKLKTHGRFLKFMFSPVNQGAGSYIFIDELEVYRGKDEWKKIKLKAVDTYDYWRAPLKKLKWNSNEKNIPGAYRPVKLTIIDGKNIIKSKAPLQQVISNSKGITFKFTGEAGKVKRMSWKAKINKTISTEKCRFALMSFKARGVLRTYEKFPVFKLVGINSSAKDNDIPLLEANMIPNDGQSHTIIKKLPEGFSLQEFQIVLPSHDDSSQLTIERFELVKKVPDVFTSAITKASKVTFSKGFVPVKLYSLLNGSISGWFKEAFTKYNTIIDGVSSLKGGDIKVSKIPFKIASGKFQLAKMPESHPSTKRVKFLRQTVDKCFLGPKSRNDFIEINTDNHVSEAFFLLALSAPVVQRRGGIPNGPFRLDDIECISVELTYDRGKNEIAFPYSVADRGCFVPARELGAYGVAVDKSRKLKKITLRVNQFGYNFAIAALTLNTGSELLAPEMRKYTAAVKVKQNAEPAGKVLKISRKGKKLKISNQWYEYYFNLTEGFVISGIINKWNPNDTIKLAPSSGLRIRHADKIYTGRCFRAMITEVKKNSVKLKLVSRKLELPLNIIVEISANESSELKFSTEVINHGSKAFSSELCLPALVDLKIGNIKDTCMFFPQYRTVNTSEKVVLRAPYGPEYTLQFMDIYNPAAGTGLMVRTDNKKQSMVDFCLRKDKDGVSGGVYFPTEYNQLGVQKSRIYPPVSLFVHNGDWHQALKIYRKWVSTWYKPYKSQNKKFFLNAWNLNCYRPSEKLSWRESRFPGFITPDRKEFLTEECFAFEKEELGHIADFIHFYNWTYNDKKSINEYGVFGTPWAYEQVGGIELFRKGIADIQKKWKRPVSLYTLIDRVRISALSDQKLVKEIIAAARHKAMDNDPSSKVRATGKRDGVVFLPTGYAPFIDFFIKDVIKMQRDTGCQLVYVDVFPHFSHLGKGAKGITPRQADISIVKRLRKELPEDVVLWTEYSFTDVASQYADGALVYYFLELNETFARIYNLPQRDKKLMAKMPINTGRFALPQYKTIGLPVYIEASNKPSQVDALFFNGEAFQEDTWRLHHSHIRKRINRSYAVKRKYNDCFTSKNPIPFIETQAAGIVANLFPGENRKVWTLFNGRPKTYSGAVLAIPHVDGAKYRDIWNDKELHPKIIDGKAIIKLTLNPQMVGAVVQEIK